MRWSASLGPPGGTCASPCIPEPARSCVTPAAMPVLSLSWGSQLVRGRGGSKLVVPQDRQVCAGATGRPSVWKWRMRPWGLVQSPALMRPQGLVGEAAGGRCAGPGRSGSRASSLSCVRNRVGAREQKLNSSLPHWPSPGHSRLRHSVEAQGPRWAG